MTLGLIDILVLLASFVLAIWIGVRTGKGKSSADDYMFGGRDLPWWAILGSIVATETSTATVLSVTGLGYGDVGFKFLQLALGYIIGRLFVVTVLLPLFFKGTVSSAYEVLKTRFGQTSTHAASLLFLVTRNIGDGLRLYLAAVAVQKLVGWDFYISAIAIGVVTIFYTYIGGMRSVVWNDCTQLLIYLAGGIATVFVIASQIDGGWGSLMEFARTSGKLNMINASPPKDSNLLDWLVTTPYTLWVGLIGGAVLTLGTHGTDQMMIQRYLSARSQRDAGKAIFASSLVVFLQFALFLFIGIELACFYQQNPLDSGATVLKGDEVYAHFLMTSFPQNTGLIGLMFAAIMAAAMSTLSSSLNSSATAVVNDFYLPASRQKPSQSKLLVITQLLTIVFGVIQVAVGMLASMLSKSVVDSALTIAGYSAGLLLGLFLLGILTRRVNQRSALAGASVGLLTLLIVQFALPYPDYLINTLKVPLPSFAPIKVTGIWYALIGSSVTFVSGIVLSYVHSAFATKQD
jgi:solute:Na+ symporter, SSS family